MSDVLPCNYRSDSSIISRKRQTDTRVQNVQPQHSDTNLWTLIWTWKRYDFLSLPKLLQTPSPLWISLLFLLNYALHLCVSLNIPPSTIYISHHTHWMLLLFVESFDTADLLSSGRSFVISLPRSYIPSFYSLMTMLFPSNPAEGLVKPPRRSNFSSVSNSGRRETSALIKKVLLSLF